MTDGTIPELKMENRKWKMENGKWNELEHVLPVIDSVHTYIRTYAHTYIRVHTSFSKKFSTQIKFEFDPDFYLFHFCPLTVYGVTNKICKLN